MSGKLTLCKLLAKKEEKLGQGEKIKDDCGGFIVFLNYCFSETEILIDHQLVNPSLKKNISVPKESNFHGAFLQHMVNRHVL